MAKDTIRTSALLAALGLDLASSLGDEPRFLAQPRLLGALHVELRDALGAEAAAAALLQLGFVHGLRDAARVVQQGMQPGAAQPPTAPAAPRIALQLARAPGAGHALHLEGAWPERSEAEALREVLEVADAPGCSASAGYTAGWLSGTFAVDVCVVEVACVARGDETCRFEAREAEAWRADGDAAVQRCLEALSFDALRRMVADALAGETPPREPERFQPGSPAVHVWGPVMVIPFAGVEESLRALELIGSEPGAREVRVVVVDLTDAILDEGFGALALEQILAAIEGWGAEPMLAGASPLSRPVIEDLAHGPLLVCKDLPEAIARAFQIAQLQRSAV